jgi:hypothetical protein
MPSSFGTALKNRMKHIRTSFVTVRKSGLASGCQGFAGFRATSLLRVSWRPAARVRAPPAVGLRDDNCDLAHVRAQNVCFVWAYDTAAYIMSLTPAVTFMVTQCSKASSRASDTGIG